MSDKVLNWICTIGMGAVVGIWMFACFTGNIGLILTLMVMTNGAILGWLFMDNLLKATEYV